MVTVGKQDIFEKYFLGVRLLHSHLRPFSTIQERPSLYPYVSEFPKEASRKGIEIQAFSRKNHLPPTRCQQRESPLLSFYFRLSSLNSTDFHE